MTLSICLAVYNEENNLSDCLDSVKTLSNEIVVVDGGSTDKTATIAKKYGAKVIVADNPPIFHINKQRAISACKGDWILQLDADERVTTELASEIKKVINMNEKELEKYQENLQEKELFLKHQRLNSNIEYRNPKQFNAFYIARKNYFLGQFLRYGGVYPDGVIRLFKKGKARLPCKDVHELMEVDGKIGWLKNSLLHYDSPTFKRYLERNSRYIDLLVAEMNRNKMNRSLWKFIEYVILKPFGWFVFTTIFHKGILDGWRGVVFSFFSALRFPRAYLKYLAS